jgi:hypothetical protein
LLEICLGDLEWVVVVDFSQIDVSFSGICGAGRICLLWFVGLFVLNLPRIRSEVLFDRGVALVKRSACGSRFNFDDTGGLSFCSRFSLCLQMLFSTRFQSSKNTLM